MKAVARQTMSDAHSYFPTRASIAENQYLPTTGDFPETNDSPNDRVPRPDAMFHYPFHDDTSKVADILTDDRIASTNKFLELGLPAQKRAILKVYDIMKTGATGLKYMDVPEALNELGLQVPHHLEKAFTGASNSLADSEVETMKKLSLSLHEWQLLVDKYVNVMKRGPHVLAITPPEYFLGRLPSKNQRGEGQGSQQLVHQEPSPAGDLGEYLTSVNQEKSPPKEIVKPSPRKNRRESPKYLWKDSYTSRIRKIQSKIRDEVKKDRSRFESSRVKVDKHALAAVARGRLEEIFSQESNPSTLTTRPSVTKKSIARYRDLSTGSAALKIADNFLRGDLGREVSHQGFYGPSDPTESIHDLLIRDSNEKITGRLDADQRAAALYKHEWTPSRGGWMADFGESHSHTFVNELLSSSTKQIQGDGDNIIASTVKNSVSRRKNALDEISSEEDSPVESFDLHRA